MFYLKTYNEHPAVCLKGRVDAAGKAGDGISLQHHSLAAAATGTRHSAIPAGPIRTDGDRPPLNEGSKLVRGFLRLGPHWQPRASGSGCQCDLQVELQLLESPLNGGLILF